MTSTHTERPAPAAAGRSAGLPRMASGRAAPSSLKTVRRLALGGVLAGAAAGSAPAQLLPQVGVPVELGDLRRTFERAYERQPPISERAWTIVPAIDATISATDNARGIGEGRQGWELMSVITPSLSVQGSTARLNATLYYAPQLRAFANAPSQNAIGQNLSADARATIFEDLLFLNASAYATEQSRAGGLGAGSTGNLARQDRVQTYSFNFGPLLQRRFGDYGVVEAGYNIGYLDQGGRGVAVNTPFAPALARKATITNTAHLAFSSGQEFGRISFGGSIRRITYDGSGVLKNAHRYSEVAELNYAVTRNITALGEFGHQDIRYGGLRPVRINGPLWSVGARWNPDPDTTMTLRYGRRDGGNSISFDGTTAPTARTRLSARYSEGVSSGLEDLQGALGSASFDSFGTAVDSLTGVPLVLNDNFAGTQGGVARVQRLSVTGILIRDIDSFSITVTREERRTLSSNVPGAAPTTSYTNGSLSWQRELGVGLRGNALVSYGERSAGGPASATQETLTFSAGLNYAFSETLSSRATYTFTHSSSNRPGFGYDMNLLTLGLHKSF